jgi:hypothetical protein
MRDSTNRLLEFLTAPAKPAGDACRSNPRREATAKVELSWLESFGWRTIPAKLSDISKGGASLVARSSPPTVRQARLRITDGEGSAWVEAKIVGVEPANSTRHRIRLQFHEPCPTFFLGLAVIEADDACDQPSNLQGWNAWTPVA